MIKHVLKLLWNKKASNALMILEIFLSFIVLFFVLSYVFFNLGKVNQPLGFETIDIWKIQLDGVEQRDSLEAVTTLQNLKTELLSMEEIEAVSFTESIVPFQNSQWRTGSADNGFQMTTLLVPVDEDLKKVMGLNITEGRWFNEDDLNSSMKPLIVNQEFIDRYYPNKSMVDSTFILNGDRKIIGVIDQYRYIGEFEENHPTVLSIAPYFQNMSAVLLKMKGNTPTAFEEKLSQRIANTTKSTGNVIVDLEKERIENSRESWVLIIALLAICGFLCLNVALGLFGVLWYNINKRKAEIGLRQALGANGFDITKQFILEILVLTGIAILIAIFFTIQIPLLKVTEYPNSLFYKSIGFSTLIILILVTICALFPSVQAAKITPANSLHED